MDYFPDAQRPPLHVERLGLAELMKNHHVQALFTDLQESNKQVIQNAQIQHALYQENLRLKLTVDELRIDNKRLEYDFHTFLDVYLILLEHFRPLLAPGHRPFTIAPSDSFSCNASSNQTTVTTATCSSTLLSQPALRPMEYPEEILWCLEDCKSDPDVQLKDTNTSRPPMEKCIRDENGNKITPGEWSAIKVSSRMLVHDLLSLPKSKDRRAIGQSKTKKYFKAWHREEWYTAVSKLETQQPILALCAAHWKADHVLGNTLAAGGHGAHYENEVSDVETNATSQMHGVNAKKHSLPSSPRKSKKKKKREPEGAKEKREPERAKEKPTGTRQVRESSLAHFFNPVNKFSLPLDVSSRFTPAAGTKEHEKSYIDTTFIQVDPSCVCRHSYHV